MSPDQESREEATLERFIALHPEGGHEAFERWAAEQAEFRDDPELRRRTEKLLSDYLRAADLLAERVERAGAEGLSLYHDAGARGDGSQTAADRSVNARLVEGQRIGPFVLIRFIASGGMGQVWEAEDQDLRRRVALKTMLPGRVDTRSLELFGREARAGGRLSHPNLVTTLAYGEHEGLSWIAQEFVEGSWTLKDFLDDQRSGSAVPDDYYPKLAELLAKIADGLQAAHDAGVIHRDVKPQNILIAPDDTPKLTDFGLARITEDSFHSVTGDFVGTFAYMSPEQVTAKRVGLDHRTDVFSFGVVMYEVLALRRPFEGDTTHQIAERILFYDPPRPAELRSRCPFELMVICGKALEKAPDRRYQSMGELAADLRRYLHDEPIQARPPGTLHRVAKWVLRNPTKSLVGAVAGVATILLAGLGLVAIRSAGVAEQRAEDLAEANLGLATQSSLARTSQRAAEEQARRAAERLDELLVLVASHDLESLVRRAEALWPPHPEMVARYEAWLEEARALRDGREGDAVLGTAARPGLAGLRSRIAALRSSMVDETDDRRLQEIRRHPDHPALLELDARRQWLARMLGREAWPQESAFEEGRAIAGLPEDVEVLVGMAWSLAGPERPVHGEEARGLAIARRAVQLAGEGNRLFALVALGWAEYRAGLLEDARATVEEAGAVHAAATPAPVLREDGRTNDFANVYWSPGSRLRCMETGAEILPDAGGLYDIWTAANEAELPVHGVFDADSLRRLALYKFKDHEAARSWCERASAGRRHAGLVEALAGWGDEALDERARELDALEARVLDEQVRLGLRVFPDATDTWWLMELEGLTRGIEALFAEGAGLATSALDGSFGWGMERRLAFARGIAARSVSGDEARARWAEAVVAIAASPRYGGLELAPQMGLLPLGPDARSGLWEFAHLQTGSAPERSGDGDLVLTEESGLVLVLIPAGSFLMGAQAADPVAQNHDPLAKWQEQPPHRVELSAHFVSKYEMTRGQWERATGREAPQEHLPIVEAPPGPDGTASHGVPDPLLYPVAGESWIECQRWMGRMGLSLPSEAQWEHAARAGTTTAWWTGPDLARLEGMGNLDGSADGCHASSRPGTFPGNAFGLHDVLGNVSEWCLDGQQVLTYREGRGADPVVSWSGTEKRIVRGGNYREGPSLARSSSRSALSRDHRARNLGVRPARGLEP